MPNERALAVISDLERTLVEFICKHRITHDEYRQATDLIIAEVRAGEESLLFDVFLEAAATDVGNIGRRGSMEAIEGPFYLPGAPQLSAPYQMPRRADEAGDTLVFCGRVTSADGVPLAGVELDMWQADAAGLYSNIHPGIPDWNLRGRFRSASDGTFEITTIVPPPYEIPKRGPTGTVLGALGRHFHRPAHLHVKLRHPGYGQMTSQLYFEGGQYLDSDVANAVRDGLVLPLTRHDDPADIARRGLIGPFYEARYDFALAPEAQDAARANR